jgi:hypothetical protein
MRSLICTRRFLMPAALVGAGIYLLIGCIPFPGNYKASGKKERPEKLIGPADSTKPVRIGQAGWDQAIVYLGQPLFAAAGRSITVHQYQVNTTTSWSPLCFWTASKEYRPRYLLMRFDEQGKLESFSIYRDLRKLRTDVGVPLDPVPTTQQR